MPLARIITRTPQDAVGASEYLRSLGYTVETVSPEEFRVTPAELELNLDRCGAAEAVERALALVESGAAVAAEMETLPAPEPAPPQKAKVPIAYDITGQPVEFADQAEIESRPKDVGVRRALAAVATWLGRSVERLSPTARRATGVEVGSGSGQAAGRSQTQGRAGSGTAAAGDQAATRSRGAAGASTSCGAAPDQDRGRGRGGAGATATAGNCAGRRGGSSRRQSDGASRAGRAGARAAATPSAAPAASSPTASARAHCHLPSGSGDSLWVELAFDHGICRLCESPPGIAVSSWRPDER